MVRDAVNALKKAMEEENIDPRKGLTEELFIFSTSIVPTVNVDLFITNTHHELLLVWRDDKYCGKGWHIPGGCVRLKETLEERVQRTAQGEVGSTVIFDKDPIVVREDINKQDRYWLDNQLERSHNISFLYNCIFPDGFVLKENENIRWFDTLPEDLLAQHRKLYGDIFSKFFEGGIIQ